jgi:Tol biopolymer transport system component
VRTGRTLHPEDVISRYRVVGPLGAGGMGEVYLAQDQSLERNVALKVLPPELVKDPDRVRRFVLEAKSASSLSHPNIVTIYEIGQDVVRTRDGGSDPDSAPVQFMSMELINGKTLSTIIHDDRTDVRTLLGYLAQAAEGLAKAHAAGIVHRDLKPGNIMVSADGFTKVLDFGLAKLTEKRDADPELSSAPTRLEDATGAGAVIGTTGYMSPEQVQGKPVDHRSDIFSFGCLLYEAATRQRPFVAESAVETMHKILHDKPVPVEERNPQVPGELRRVIRRCLAKSPDQRVQSMKDVALELREIVDEWDTLSASQASSGSTIVGGTGTAAAKPRPPIAVIAGAAIVALAAVAVAIWVMRPAQRDDAPQPFQTMKLSTQTSRGDVTDAVISRDGRYLAYLTGEVGKTSVRVRQVATGSDVEVVPSEEGLFEGLSFTPDGNYLFYLKRRRDAPNYRALMQVPSLGGASRERAFDVDTRVSFAPDGKRAVFVRGIPQERKSNIVMLDVDAGTERVLASIVQPHSVPGAPSWSPDGKRIAVIDLDTSTGGYVSTLAVFDAVSGQREDLNVAKGGIHESLAWLPDGKGIVRAGYDLGTSVSRQISLVAYPGGSARRVTNDVNDYVQVTASSGDEAIAAVRFTRLSNLWVADPTGAVDARPITRFTNAESSPFGVTTASDGSVIFAAPRDQSVQVWSVGIGGGEPKAITPGESLAVNPRSVPTGVIYDRWDSDGGIHVWRIDFDGSHAKALTPSAPAQIADVARDGSVVTYIQLDSERTIWAMAGDGSSPRSLGSGTSRGLISSDGKRILVTRLATGAGGLIHPEAEVVPAVGGEAIARFPIPAQADGLAWSPDGASFTFIDRSDPAWNLATIRLNGGAPERLTRFDDGRITQFRWSPDGTRLATARKVGDAAGVWVTAADGSKPVPIARFQGDDIFGLDWTRDGKQVVINAGKRSSDAVLIRNFR